MRLAPFFAVLIAAVPARAQVVRGVVVDAASGSPINGGIVVLLDASAQQHAGGFTDAQGRFELRAPAGGRWRVRAEHVSFLGAMTPLLDVATGRTVDVRLELRRMTVQLSAIRIEETRRCVINPERGAETATLWESVRTALRGTALTSAQKRLGLRIAMFERELDARGTEQWRRRRERTTFSETPFVSVPIEELEREGFVVDEQGTMRWRMPDATVLLSERFLDAHCFRLAAPTSAADASLIGLAFEPAEGRTRSDVRGVLWVDRASAELRRMEITFANLEEPLFEEHALGRIEFRRLPTGHWIVGRWILRMPTIREHRITDRSGALVRAERSLLAIREVGGEVVEILGDRASARVPARIVGTVFDSTRGAALADARVFVSGTSLAATSDVAGRFVLEVPPGEYVISFVHPRLDTLAAVASAAGVTLADGDSALLTFAAPSWPTLVRAHCGDSLAARHGAVVGWVRSAESGLPIEEAVVTILHSDARIGSGVASTRRGRADTRTDREGAFRACGIPGGGSTRVVIGADGYVPAEARVDVRAGELTRIDRALPRAPGRLYMPPPR